MQETDGCGLTGTSACCAQGLMFTPTDLDEGKMYPIVNNA